MGLTFAKSVRFGAVRFNFTGAGIGMSVGIPGLRIGTGPRGAYISGGAGGFKYRRSLNTRGASERAVPATPHTPQPVVFTPEASNVVATTLHDTQNVLQLTDSSSDALLQSMNEQRGKMPLWPLFSVIALLCYFVLASQLQSVSPVWRFVLAAVLGAGCAWAWWRDSMRKLTVLFYEPDAATNEHFHALCASASAAANSRKLKSISSTSRYSDTKYTAGAAEGLAFSTAELKLGQAPGVAANIEVPLLKTAKTTLAFFPDRVLAFQGKAVGAVSYAELQARAVRTRYIESETVPGDATVIDRTWQYVNKSGGPDRRFKNNRELPICAYSTLLLSAHAGLDIRLMSSRDAAFEPVAAALCGMDVPGVGLLNAASAE